MNSVNLIGRLTKDVEIRRNGEHSVASFTLAINRPQSGEKQQADFPRIVVFGKQAENCAKYLRKGSLVGVEGRLQTGSYTKEDGTKVFTTDVAAQRVDFLSSSKQDGYAPAQGMQGQYAQGQPAPQSQYAAEVAAPDGFNAEFDEDIPF